MRDRELLKQYLDAGSETAFAELVQRYLDLAYSVARRQMRDSNLAEEVVQKTFCLLAQKAPELSRYESAAGWIYRATFNISLKTLRDERRRREREHTMAELNYATQDTAEPPWEGLLPLLDDALSALPDRDRTALALRFVQGKSMRELGVAMDITEAAAKMRVGRALDRVRKHFQSHGVACSATSLVAALSALSADAAPAGLAASVVAGALAHSSGNALAAGSITKILFLMAKLKTKLILLGCGAAAVVLSGSYLVDHMLTFVRKPVRANVPLSAPTEFVQLGQQPTNRTSTFRRQVADKLREAGLARAVAKLKATLDAPPRKGTRSYPSPQIIDALASFEGYQDEAFAILKDTIGGDNLEAKLQAISALGTVGKSVPEAKSLLWELLRSGQGRVSFTALSSLGNVGFVPEEIPNLAALIPSQTDQSLIRYIPEQIARAIKRDPEAMKPFLGPVEALLQNEDSVTRFCAACALAELRGGQDQDILRGLTAGLAVSDQYRLRHEATGEVGRHIMAVETLQRMGPDAKAAIPDLQTFVRLTPDPVLREVALRAIGAIDPDAGRSEPEIGSILARDESRSAMQERLQAGTWSADDLIQGLKEPTTVTLAASHLADLGPNAKGSLPDLDRALAGKDEATRDEIVTAIKQIDPNYVVSRVAREPVAQGALAAQMELESQRSQGELDEAAAKALEGLIDQFRFGNTSWYTQNELTDFKGALEKRNPRIWEAFLGKASEADPNFPGNL
jgi:RNA polymerase sigma factor (sigma-70 family)